MALLTSLRDGLFAALTDAKLLSYLSEAFGFEFSLLRHATPTIEAASDSATQQHGESTPVHVPGTISSTPQDTSSNPTDNGFVSPSMALFGAEYAEVNRTCTSLLAIRWLLDKHEGFDTFTTCQPADERLSLTSFQQLAALITEVFASPDDVYALMVLLVVSDLGKVPGLVDQLDGNRDRASDGRDVSISGTPSSNGTAFSSSQNHDEIVYEIARHNRLPLLRTVAPTHKSDVLLALQFAANVNIPQLVQGECVPGSLCGASCIASSPRALLWKFIEVVLDVAGAAAHENARGSITLRDGPARSLFAAYTALQELVVGKISAIDCYNRVLADRAQRLHSDGFRLLDVEDKNDRALLRLLALGRVYSCEEAEVYEATLRFCPQYARTPLIEGLSRTGMSPSDAAVVPYYMPGLIHAGLRNRELGPPEDDSRASVHLTWLFEFLARVLHVAPGSAGNLIREGSVETSGSNMIIERSVAFAKSLVESQEFARDPSVLQFISLPWEDQLH